jgi:hypothetical protein
MKVQSRNAAFVICIDNTEYPAALEVRKIYQVIPDEQASVHHLLRIIDESGEDYLYPEALFIHISLPPNVEYAIFRAA